MTSKIILSEADVAIAANKLAAKLAWDKRRHVLYGVPRGGCHAAVQLMLAWGEFARPELTYDPTKATLFIDDLIDSGATRERYANLYGGVPFHALYNKQEDESVKGQWLIFPWEINGTEDTSAHDIVTRLFQFIGEDPDRGGLKETPARFLKAWKEWASGYALDPKDVLKTFEDGANGYDELVIVHNIPVISKCEHHLADIVGHAHVGYIPDGKIVGLSKLARVVDLFSRRLQVQERLVVQIADCINEHLKPKGVGVVIRASHACMSSRGVKIHGSTTTTSAVRGALFNKPEARKEFFDLCKMAEDKS